VHLASQTGAKPRWSEAAGAFLPGELGTGTVCAGAVRGTGSLRGCLEEGALAGATAASRAGFGSGRATRAAPDVEAWPEAPARFLFLVPHAKRVSRAPNPFVGFQLDVTAADIELAAREGYESVEHVKRYTALGFGTDQGKLGNVNAIGILADTLSEAPGAIGTTTYRPPYVPVSFGAIAGKDTGEVLLPSRRTALTDRIEAAGAVMFEAGAGYRRPSFFPRDGESAEQAIAREALACRTAAGRRSTMSRCAAGGSWTRTGRRRPWLASASPKLTASTWAIACSRSSTVAASPWRSSA